MHQQITVYVYIEKSDPILTNLHSIGFSSRSRSLSSDFSHSQWCATPRAASIVRSIKMSADWDPSSTIHGWLSAFSGMCCARWNGLFIGFAKNCHYCSARSRLISSITGVYHRLWADTIRLIKPVLCISGIVRRQTSSELSLIWQVFAFAIGKMSDFRTDAFGFGTGMWCGR